MAYHREKEKQFTHTVLSEGEESQSSLQQKFSSFGGVLEQMICRNHDLEF
jgi:hypothetical protein